MPSYPKKTLIGLSLAALVGTACLARGGLLQLAIDMWAEARILDALVSAAGYVVDNVSSLPDGVQRLKDKAMDGYYRIKIPALKRNVNFVMIKNASRADWTFQVAVKAQNEDGRPESGTVSVYRQFSPGDTKDLELVAMLDQGNSVTLKPGLDYIFYPNLAGKVLGSKRFADDFVRTVYLRDANGRAYACNLCRKKDEGAKATFGIAGQSMNVLYASKGLALGSDKDPSLADMIFITKDQI